MFDLSEQVRRLSATPKSRLTKGGIIYEDIRIGNKNKRPFPC